jgi:predicted transcriptional regulator
MPSVSDSKFEFALGPLESEVMEAAWRLGGGWVTIADVLDERERAGGSKLAYSTIKAVVSNLHDKGHLRKRSEGKQNAFKPVLTREKFAARAIGRVVAPLLRDHRNPLLAHIVDELIDDEEGLAELQALLAAKQRLRAR